MQKLYQKISSLVSLSSLLSSGNPPRGKRVLLYHAIGKKVADDSNGLCTVSTEDFKQQIKLLNDLNLFQFTSMEKPVSAEARELSITFDDGYLDNLKIAAPLLCSLKIPFTVFVISDFVKQKKTEYLTPVDLKELSTMPGVTIGSHGRTHIPFTQLAEQDLKKELTESKAYLEDIIQKPVQTISYPHGKTSLSIATHLKEAGYSTAGCSLFGVNREEINPYFIKRTSILSSDNAKTVEQKVFGHWDWFALRQKLQN